MFTLYSDSIPIFIFVSTHFDLITMRNHLRKHVFSCNIMDKYLVTITDLFETCKCGKINHIHCLVENKTM